MPQGHIIITLTTEVFLCYIESSHNDGFTIVASSCSWSGDTEIVDMCNTKLPSIKIEYVDTIIRFAGANPDLL